MDLGPTGKRALVTGASKGIGAATAGLLAREGCDVILVSRSADALDGLARQIAAETRRALSHFAADSSDPHEIKRLADGCGNPDILVNNAGAITGGRLTDVDEATWRKAWDLKVFGSINLTRRSWLP